MTVDTQVSQAAGLLLDANCAVALTGAGISTPSGIPDFRSPGSGLWESTDSFEVATIYGFRRNPTAFYDWVRPLARVMYDAQPNPAHFALAELEQAGVLDAVITQNIDGLHQLANSTVVHEVHGHMREGTCIRCYKTVPVAPMLEGFIETGRIPRCDSCGGVIKPDVILIGEQLPAAAALEALQAARRCDVMLVVGSSLEIIPAGDMPRLAKEHDGKLVIINLGRTRLDYLADVVIHADVAEVLPRLSHAVCSRLT